MNVETVTRIIAVILAPVVMVTACAIMLNGMLVHYAEVSMRLRAMAGERLGLVLGSGDAGRSAAFRAERLSEIDEQLPELLSRHKQIRNAVSLVFLAALLFIADMFVISVSAVSGSRASATAGLAVFLVSTGVLFWGLLLAVIEVSRSHHAVQNEVRRVAGLDEAQGTDTPLS